MEVFVCNGRKGSWGGHFMENMGALGLQTPSSLFDTAKTTLLTIGPIIGAVEKFGTTATLGELVTGATQVTVASEVIIASAGVLASAYGGAVVGSAFVASVYSVKCDISRATPVPKGQTGMKSRFNASDVIEFAKRNEVYAPWMEDLFRRQPEIIDPAVATALSRKHFALRNRA